MAIPTPATWAPLEVPTASKLNSGVRDPASFAINPPAALVKRSSAQTIPNNTFTLLIWQVETLDNDGMVDLGTSATRATVTESGLYAFGSALTWTNNSTGSRSLELLVNGSAVSQDRRGASLSTAHAIVSTEVLAAGDYVEAGCSQTSGANLDTNASIHPRLWVVRLSG